MPGSQGPRPPRGRDPRQPRRPQRPSRGEIVFGVEPVRELITVAPRAIQSLYVKAGAYERFNDEIEAVRQAGGRVIRTEDDALARMAGSEGRHQGIIAEIREYAYTPLEQLLELKPDPLLVVDGVTDPRNLGAIMRSTECAGGLGLVLARDRTAGVTPAAVKSSSGAWIHLKIAQCGNVAQTIEALKAEGYWIVALDPHGETSLYDLDVTRRLAIVVGSEDRGIREIVRNSADFVVGIPMAGRVGSLNVAVAAGIAMFEIARHRGLNGNAPQLVEVNGNR
ncbi:MAG TPA: 23S rRNA (guanosine(2251)-2'-O)-methyltransferase RlmB [Candidatus Binataceae bacterium]|jgi:23S rRNA (guanosine2251-2'-O)-methyltransferase|nr:23S rRNA (guanosine(2251)-2'-O)-methyltransferase RlmB [Candidatus Binataceae bacterium]